MAPDLNSVPASPRTIASSSRPTSTSSSRRASQLMGPPPLPLASPGGSLPQQSYLSGQPPAIQASSNMANTTASPDNAGVGMGPGPLRHPRPLTAADLHLQLEKEQEAVVNRLTRELSLLRQQSASVVSNASSTSTGLADSSDHHANHLLSGASHPTPSRRHRSSSSLSTRSITTPATTASGSTVGTTAGIAGSTISGITPARDNTIASTSQAAAERARETLSRQNSMTSSRRSGTSSPSMSSSLQHADHFLNSYSNRHSISSQHSHHQSVQFTPTHTTTIPDNPRSPSLSSSAAATARYEEAAYHRSELETVKRENEILRRRIRELERGLSAQRDSHADHRRRSTSTTTSMSARAGGGGTRGPTDVGSGSARKAGRGSDKDDDDETESESVQVGESAGSVGVGGGH
ncbi:hypothetical protein MMC16_007319 [Acarospora aff. strigata]|nr:hypothetical protein [Acarospora aff. strigata]